MALRLYTMLLNLLSMPEEQLIKNEASNPKHQALPIWISGVSIGLAKSSLRDTQLQPHHSVVFLIAGQPASLTPRLMLLPSQAPHLLQPIESWLCHQITVHWWRLLPFFGPLWLHLLSLDNNL